MKDTFLTAKNAAYNPSSYAIAYVDESSFQTPLSSVCKQNKSISDKISIVQTSCYQSLLATLSGEAN